jgi:hypothetical protein
MPEGSGMKIVRVGKEWEILCPPFEVDGEEFGSMGPYDTRADAESDMSGIKKFIKISEKTRKRG